VGAERLEVPPGAAGTRLDVFLASAAGSRAQAQHLIDAGRVRVDGARARKRHLVRVGEVVEIEPGADVAAAERPAAPFSVAYEDEHLLVVDKPAGVVVHPARGHWTGTLAQALAGHGAAGGEEGRAGIVHRLDRDTSGLLVVARNEAVHRALKELLATRRLHREYSALVDGHPSARTGTVDAPIGRDRRDRLLVSLDSDVPREARTHFEVVELLPHCALLKVSLETGRTHQIRVHMAAIGHPVCGDPQYGTTGLYGLRRQFLHAARLAFEHPVTGASVDTTSELPDDLRVALEAAASEGRQGLPGRGRLDVS
jgi:23S rRNA pseudouridine1911/1915/1917 synthase